MKKDCQRILEHLKTHGALTSLEALRLGFGARLAARIYDLRAAGHKIVADSVEVQRADGTPTRVARYRLEAGVFLLLALALGVVIGAARGLS